jgi:hypothetical protein
MRRLVLVMAAMAALTACGSGGGGDGVASLNDGKKPSGQNEQTGGTDQDKMREFTKCMREHGVDMPEPDAQGRIAIKAVGPDEADKSQKADEACKSLLPNGGKPKELSPEDLDKARQEAKCMREHGINMPDPDPNNPGMRGINSDGDQEKMQKAFKECGMGDMIGAAPVAPAGGGGK